MAGIPLDLQLLNMCAALLLLLSFAMLAQRRVVNLVNLLALQGTLLFVATLLLAWRTRQPHLYVGPQHQHHAPCLNQYRTHRLRQRHLGRGAAALHRR